MTRSLYLGALWVLILTVWQTAVGWEQPATLGDEARFGILVFQVLAYVQLFMLLFFAALSAASTVAQEKDRRTFVLLLLTDLRNYEIVLGKLLGSLLQIGLFLAGTVPVLSLLLLMGGIDFRQIIQATLILATTALAAGSLGGLIALWRDKTFQSLALTVLCLMLYLCLVQALALLPLVTQWYQAGPGLTSATVLEWQTWLQPFLALQQVLDPHDIDAVFPPAYGFALAMLALTFLLNAWAILRLRVWNPSGEPIMQRESAEEDAEMKDRAGPMPLQALCGRFGPIRLCGVRSPRARYGRRPLLVKAAYFLVLGLIGYYALAPGGHRRVGRGARTGADHDPESLARQCPGRDGNYFRARHRRPRSFAGYGPYAAGVHLRQAAGHLVQHQGVFAAAPFAGRCLRNPRGCSLHPRRATRSLRSAIILKRSSASPSALTILLAFTMVLGIHVALRTENSRLAIINTLGTVFFLSIGTLVCIYLILINGRFEYQWLSFLAFVLTGVGGLLWVLCGARPSSALTLASWACPFAVFYTVTNVLIGKPGIRESTDPLIPFLVTGGAFSFAVAAVLVPLLSEFDVALGRTSALGD